VTATVRPGVPEGCINFGSAGDGLSIYRQIHPLHVDDIFSRRGENTVRSMIQIIDDDFHRDVTYRYIPGSPIDEHRWLTEGRIVTVDDNPLPEDAYYFDEW
jgi:hypothetical protein